VREITKEQNIKEKKIEIVKDRKRDFELKDIS
jgi:hypothetical protein